jgi:hypothetical protein
MPYILAAYIDMTQSAQDSRHFHTTQEYIDQLTSRQSQPTQCSLRPSVYPSISTIEAYVFTC